MKKVLKIIGYVFLSIVALFVLGLIFEIHFITKNKVQNFLSDQGILLNNEFIIERNDNTIFSGHRIFLEISENDKEQIIQKIKNEPGFIGIGKPVADLEFDTKDRYRGPRQKQNYETETSFVREYFEPTKPGYAPTYRRIIIYKENNELMFEDIDY